MTLRDLLIMAYNCGRAHEAERKYTLEAGRRLVADTLEPLGADVVRSAECLGCKDVARWCSKHAGKVQ